MTRDVQKMTRAIRDENFTRDVQHSAWSKKKEMTCRGFSLLRHLCRDVEEGIAHTKNHRHGVELFRCPMRSDSESLRKICSHALSTASLKVEKDKAERHVDLDHLIWGTYFFLQSTNVEVQELVESITLLVFEDHTYSARLACSGDTGACLGSLLQSVCFSYPHPWVKGRQHKSSGPCLHGKDISPEYGDIKVDVIIFRCWFIVFRALMQPALFLADM